MGPCCRPLSTSQLPRELTLTTLQLSLVHAHLQSTTHLIWPYLHQLALQLIRKDVTRYRLSIPSFTPMASQIFLWGTCDTATIMFSMSSAYNEVIHWKKKHLPRTIWQGRRVICHWDSQTLSGICWKLCVHNPSLYFVFNAMYCEWVCIRDSTWFARFDHKPAIE